MSQSEFLQRQGAAPGVRACPLAGYQPGRADPVHRGVRRDQRMSTNAWLAGRNSTEKNMAERSVLTKIEADIHATGALERSLGPNTNKAADQKSK